MKITTVLFDLDGTLLPMDQEEFTTTYFKLLATKMAPYGYEPKKLISSIWEGTVCMLQNTGTKTNEEVFWDKFISIYGDDVKKHIGLFEEFYQNDFANVKSVCGYNEKAKDTVLKLKKQGYRVALATNPIFPDIATKQRIQWTGLNEEDFEFYTTYENEKYCKPNTKYYQDIVDRIGVNPKECIMVGNDVSEDMVAEKLGMKVFLITDNIINKSNEDISKYPNGSFDELIKFIDDIN